MTRSFIIGCLLAVAVVQIRSQKRKGGLTGRFGLESEPRDRYRRDKVDGNWSDWSCWSDCSATCGGGTRTRSRSCTNPAPENGGSYCSGTCTEEMACNTQNCPVDGGWSDWSDWIECSATCGGGYQTRSRSCDDPEPAHGGSCCAGNSTDVRECNTHDCPGRCQLLTVSGLQPAKSDGSVLLSGTDGAHLLNTRETSLMMMKNSFTLYVNMKVTGSNHWQAILGSFKNPWMFLLRLRGSQLCVILRRNYYPLSGGGGADPNQDMVWVCGCTVAKNEWQQVGFNWDRSIGMVKLYVNGEACASKTSIHTDRDLQDNNRTSWELGYKGDTNNERLSGSVQHVCVSKGVTVPTYCNTCGADAGYCMDTCA